MRIFVRIAVAAISVLGFAAVAHAHPNSISGTCTNWPSPQVTLNWNLPGHRDVNNIQKGDHPGGTFWGFIGPDDGGGAPFWGQAGVSWLQTSYVDTFLTTGVTYSWRTKTHTYDGSGSYTVKINACNCGGSCPPTDNATVTVTGPAGTVDTNQPFNVAFLATNTGTSTWNASHTLNATNPANSAFWSAASSVATGTVGPGVAVLRVVPFIAPAVPGTYPVAPWRMFKAGPGFFGSASAPASVTVVVPNQPATGQSETATCGGLTGWAQDPDTPASALTVRIYRDGPMGLGALAATPTANLAHAAPYNGHGYAWTPPTDGIAHAYYVYALDPQSSLWTHLSGSPTASLTCWPAPTATLTSVTQGNYCTGGPQVTANWQYTSAGGSPQTQWQIQVATDPGFAPASLVYNPGVKPTLPQLPPPSVHSAGTGLGVLQFNTTYWVRVMTWDALGQPSPWSNSLSTTTAASAYPVAAFTYAPSQVFAGQPIQFTDASSNGPTAWAWNFGDGQLGSGANPTHIFAAQGSYPVQLDATNASGTCSVTKVLDANKPLPSYREVGPGSSQ